MTQLRFRTICVLLLIITAGQALYAAQQCGNEDFKGVYGMSATGTITFAPPPFSGLIGQFARAGRVVADGKGDLSVLNTASYNGRILTEPYTGKYAVSGDCSVVIDVTVPLPAVDIPGPLQFFPVPFEFVGALADDGRDVSVMAKVVGSPANPPGNTIRVRLNRQGGLQAECSNRNLTGGYQLDMSGTNVTGAPVLGPFAREGRLVFDGAGGFTGQALANYSGFLLQPESLTGTYSVDSLCNVSIQYTLQGQQHTWTGTLADKSTAADLIVTNPPGAVITGNLKRQLRGEEAGNQE